MYSVGSGFFRFWFYARGDYVSGYRDRFKVVVVGRAGLFCVCGSDGD